MAHYEATATATASHVFYYRYQCEFCHQDTGWFSSEVSATGRVTGRSSGYERKAQLKISAEKVAAEKLLATLNYAKKDSAKGNIPLLSDNQAKCPDCGLLQSWGVSDTISTLFLWAVVPAMIELFMGLAIWKTGFLPFVSAGAGLAAGLLVGILRYKKKTKHIAKDRMRDRIKNKVAFNWNDHF